MSEFNTYNPDLQFTASTPIKEHDPNQLKPVNHQSIVDRTPPVQFQENTPKQPAKQEVKLPNNPTEITYIKNQQYILEYVPKEDIYPAYGYVSGNNVVIRQDLPPRVKKFVKAHELYHCQDESHFAGWLGREIRANLIPGLKDPIGFAATVWNTITDIDRIRFYLKRIKEGY